MPVTVLICCSMKIMYVGRPSRLVLFVVEADEQLHVLDAGIAYLRLHRDMYVLKVHLLLLS